MALTEADLERARQAVAAAPPLTAERREQLRAILCGCVSAQAAAPHPAQGSAADAA